MAGARLLVTLIWRSAGLLIVVRLVLAVVAGLGPVAVAWATKLLLDGLAGVSGVSVLTAAVLVGATGAAMGLIPPVSQYLDAEAARQLRRRMHDGLFAGINRMRGLAALEDPVQRDRVHVASHAAMTVPYQALTAALSLVQNVLLIGGFLAALATIGPLLAGVVAVSAVPNLLAQLSVARRRTEVVTRTAPRWRRQIFYGTLMTDPRAAKEIRLFGSGDTLRSRMDSEIGTADREERVVDSYAARTAAGLSLLTALVSGLALGLGVHRIVTGGAGLGSLAVLTAALVGVQSALTSVTSQIASGHEALRLFASYHRVVTAPVDLPDPRPPARTVPRLRRGIELRDVWFRYDVGHPWILRGLTMSIPAGRSTALLGLNGAGKSTVVKLLCRLYDPVAGTILWDGVDLRELPVEELRRRISTVFQDHMTYELTAADNIALGDVRRAPTMERIRAAARHADVDDVLAALPSGYDTLLTRAFGDGDDGAVGVPLSGGQWQRIALARAALREDADLRILDEPSTGLDPEAEYEAQRRLRTYRSGTTSLVVSHRLNTVRDIDQIVVLGDGRVVECGNHDTLLAEGGRYARMFGLQAAGYAGRVA
ncbi:ABC transporter ATP-binding protein [Plantactinospora sp. GCM10030261]|uniref:ABC transporter ATP-binding protein n=1 Tax=Plantactinospora sp. GCM10030261 TaxID=3273420 RepID=UPI003619D739